MQQIMSQIRAAVDSYQLIQSGDRIAVGISGGKDSLVLLCALANMRKFLPMKYDLVAITVDPCFDNIQTDFRQVEEKKAIPAVYVPVCAVVFCMI